jgi:hypothetical protein
MWMPHLQRLSSWVGRAVPQFVLAYAFPIFSPLLNSKSRSCPGRDCDYNASGLDQFGFLRDNFGERSEPPVEGGRVDARHSALARISPPIPEARGVKYQESVM